MFERSPLEAGVSEAWRYALVGGLVSIPLTVAYNWLYTAADSFTIGMVFFGGLVAGWLAARASLPAGQVGLRAGLIGGLPGYVWLLPAAVASVTSLASAWSSPLAAAVVGSVMALFVVGTSGFVGLLGGLAGGWLTTRVGWTKGAPARY